MKSPFRSIRQSLFNEGRLLRYLGYAIGEVILIIVGILFALKINDWNEDRKAQVEFDEYVVQLREDVKTAIDDLKEVEEFNGDRSSKIADAVHILLSSKNDPENISALEDGIHYTGQYMETHLNVGFLGQLMNGDMEIISRDRPLSLKAMDTQSEINTYLSSMNHIKSQLDQAIGNNVRYVGNRHKPLNLSLRYNVEELKTSNEFINTSQNIAYKTSFLQIFTEGIRTELEEFLTVLEEYE